MNVIFTNRDYNIYKSRDSHFIIHNKNRPFKESHTHVSNFKLAKIIIYTCIKGRFPTRSKRLENNQRVLESIVRVCPNRYYNRFSRMLFILKHNKDTTQSE